MKCREVRAAIDAELIGPRSSWLAKAESHALECPACRDALARERALGAALSGLAEPLPPPSLETGAVLRAATRHRLRAPAPAAARHAQTASNRTRDRLAWAAMLAGVCLGLVGWGYRLAIGETTLRIAPSVLGPGLSRLLELAQATTSGLVLNVAPLLCLLGILASLRERRSPPV